MERVMSVEDKIKRAEEIYYRRREQEVPPKEHIRIATKEKKDIKLFKKMIIQIIICLAIYGLFYLILNNNYIFSEDFTNKAKEILSQDINFSQIYITMSNKLNELYKKIDMNTEQNQSDEQQLEEQTSDKEQQEDQQIQENIQNNNENIGGAEEILINQEGNVDNNIQTSEQITQEPQLSQMEQDANFIKSTISFIKPLNGTISSIFGNRNPTTPTVPKNHTGTDIAAKTGTKIISATDGKVIESSSQGDFGKHLRIQVNDVIIVYAHCNKLYVKEGDIITQGQEIAEVGSTGNTTGPHLHFEIRYQNRYVNPQMILDL